MISLKSPQSYDNAVYSSSASLNMSYLALYLTTEGGLTPSVKPTVNKKGYRPICYEAPASPCGDDVLKNKFPSSKILGHPLSGIRALILLSCHSPWKKLYWVNNFIWKAGQVTCSVPHWRSIGGRRESGKPKAAAGTVMMEGRCHGRTQVA